MFLLFVLLITNKLKLAIGFVYAKNFNILILSPVHADL